MRQCLCVISGVFCMKLKLCFVQVFFFLFESHLGIQKIISVFIMDADKTSKLCCWFTFHLKSVCELVLFMLSELSGTDQVKAAAWNWPWPLPPSAGWQWSCSLHVPHIRDSPIKYQHQTTDPQPNKILCLKKENDLLEYSGYSEIYYWNCFFILFYDLCIDNSAVDSLTPT